MKKMLTKKQRVLNYLIENKKGITPLEALRMFGSFRLGAIIFDLRQEGYNITTENVRRVSKNGVSYFANYKLLPFTRKGANK